MKNVRSKLPFSSIISVVILCTITMLFTGTHVIGGLFHNRGLISLSNLYASPDAHLPLGAQQYLERALNLSATPLSQFWLGMTYEAYGKQTLATETWLEVPDVAIQYFTVRGDAASRHNNVPNAEYFYELLRRLDSYDSTPDFKLGLLYYNVAEPDKALTYLLRALELDSFRQVMDLATAHYTVAEILKERREWADAIQYAENAVRVAPQFIDAHLLLADTYFSLESFEQAYMVYSGVLNLEFVLVSNHFQALFGMARTCMRLGLFHEAVSYLEEAEEIYWADSSLYLALGDAYRNIDENAKAIGYYTKVIEISQNEQFIELARQHLKNLRPTDFSQ